MINKNKKNLGYSILEILIVLGVMAIISGIIFTMFVSFRKNQALSLDVQTITSVLRQARNQTIASKNSSSYGVHFATSTITLFTGDSYVQNNASNQVYSINSVDAIVTISLYGGGSDVVFRRLTGETSQSGSVTVSSVSTSQTKTVTIYGTGLVESQ